MFSTRTAWDRTPNLLAVRMEVLRARGVPLLDLTDTHPARCGLRLPDAALAAALRPFDAGGSQPESLGLLVAREAIREVYARQGALLSPGQLLLTASTSEAYAHLFRLLCEPGDNVLVPAPSYPLLPYLADCEAVTLKPYPLLMEHDFAIDAALVEAASDEETRAVVVVSPGNPDGHRLSGAEHIALDALCARNGWALIVDEVFVEDVRGAPPWSVTATPGEALTVSLQGISKTLGLPELKLAWMAVAGPAPVRDEALSRLELLGDTFLSVAEPVQRALPRLLALEPLFRAQVQARLADNRAQLGAARPAAAPWDVLASEGGWSAVLRLPRRADETEVCLALLDAAIRVHPGHFYDFPRGSHLVLSLLPEVETFRTALERLVRTLAHVL